MIADLEWMGCKDGDFVLAMEEQVSMNCDGWGRDLPRSPWDETQYTEVLRAGRVFVKHYGHCAELKFTPDLDMKEDCWNRDAQTYKMTKVSEKVARAFRGPQSKRYEKTQNGERVPVGTAKKRWISSNS